MADTATSPAKTRRIDLATVVPDVTAGLISGIFVIILQLSFAALIFSADLSPQLSTGIGLVLFSGFVMALVVALTSSFRVAVASPQDSPAAIFALVAATISALLTQSRDTAPTVATVFATLAITTMLTGAFFFALGYFKLGQLVRYIPYPVVGGFLAGTGWLLLQGGVNVMTGAQLTPEWFFLLSQPTVIARWLPGLVLAIVLLVVLRRWTHALITPAIILTAILIFYVGLNMTDLSIEQARDRSWMLGPFPQGALFQFVTPSAFADANWAMVLRQADKIAVIIMVSVVALLLNASGIELAVREDLDFNRELKAAGLGNLIAGIAAGFPGYHVLSASTLSHRLGARSRLTGITAAALIGFTLLFGASVLEYIPRPALGGLLCFLGISFLIDWLFDAFFKLPRLDYALIVVILAVIVVFGFLPGVGVGLVIAMLLFIVNYSRIRVVKHMFTGETYRSAVERRPAEIVRLREQGVQLLIMQLQEFIFFGTGQYVLDQVRARLSLATETPFRYLILDFRRVPALDSSAILSFQRMLQLTRAKQIETVFTSVAPPLILQLERGGIRDITYMHTLDEGAEYCENKILAQEPSPLDEIQYSFQAQLLEMLPQHEDRARLNQFLQRVEFPAHFRFICQGDPADAMYFIEQGSVSVEVDLPNGRNLRIRTALPGSVVGEMGVYLDRPRTSSVLALEPIVAYRVSAEALAEMEERDVALAAAVHKWIAVIMAERLTDELRLIEGVMD